MKTAAVLEDIQLKNCVSILLLRSEIARGLILSIQYPDMPEGYGILTSEDIPGEKQFELNHWKIPFLCSDEVLYLGQPFALLYGPSEQILHHLKEEVNVSYHEQSPWKLTISPDVEQILSEKALKKDFVDKDLLDCHHIIENTFTVPEREPISSEPYGAIAEPLDESLRITVNSRWPALVHHNCARISGLPKRQVSIRTGEMNQASEGKLWYPALLGAYAALVSRTTGLSAKLIINRHEERSFIAPGITAITHIRTGLSKDNEIEAVKVIIAVNCGYLPVFGDEILSRILISALGSYQFPKVHVKALLIRTNEPPTETTSSMGLEQTFFSIENHVTKLAKTAEITPVEWREQYLAPNFFLTKSSDWDKDAIFDLINRTIKRSDYERKYSVYEMQKKRRHGIHHNRLATRGIGIALTHQGSGFFGRGEEKSSYAVKLTLTTEGKLYLYTTMSPADQDTQGIWRKIASEILSIAVEDIIVSDNSEELPPDSGPNFLSRNTSIISKLIEQCAAAIQKRRFRDPLPLEVKRSYRGRRTNKWDNEHWTGDPYQGLSWGAAVVEIDLDPILLKPQIRGIWGTFNCGNILNPERMRQTVLTRMTDTLNWAYQWRENLLHENGHGYTYDDQKIPLPDLVFVSDKNPAKGVGGLCDPLFSAAYINAISQATGCYPDRLPLTPRILHNYLEDQ